MINNKLNFLFIPMVMMLVACAGGKENNVKVEEGYQTSTEIPIGENSWVTNTEKNAQKNQRHHIITKEGIRRWNDPKHVITTHIRVNDTGKLHVGLRLKALSEQSRLKITIGDQTVHLTIRNSTYETIPVGTFTIKDPGYQTVTIASENSEVGPIADIDDLVVGGPATKKNVNFVKDNFHFGRRGPSVHLRYPIPKSSKKPQYFYNEIEVPKGEDVIGSYFMADGFSHGYFGMQVNSNHERRILFSVWSPYDTQNPDEIPEDQRIKLLKKGTGVYAGKFGNEGSGGQSFKKFMWKAGTTYKFLLKGEPTDDAHTDYSAYFYAPETGKWQLIASFRRPKSGNYLGNLYSFLENFVPDKGNITRKAIYKNQWVYDKDQGWTPLKNAVFTADATANQKDRMDYAGGEAPEGYYLKNCGFFNDYTRRNTKFKREVKQKAPEIDFKALE